MKAFAAVAVNGTVTEIPASTTPDIMVKIVGGYLDDVDAQDDSGITAYFHRDAALKQPAVPLNPVASVVLGVEVKGTVILMGPCIEGRDMPLSDAQWRIIRTAARDAQPPTPPSSI